MIAAVGQGFFMFLMMRYSEYVSASRMRVRLLSFSCRMWSSQIIVVSKCLGIDDRQYLLYS